MPLKRGCALTVLGGPHVELVTTVSAVHVFFAAIECTHSKSNVLRLAPVQSSIGRSPKSATFEMCIFAAENTAETVAASFYLPR